MTPIAVVVASRWSGYGVKCGGGGSGIDSRGGAGGAKEELISLRNLILRLWQK